MGRGDRGSIPFNQRRDDGPKAYRTEDEPVDERPLLMWGELWASENERQAYERAVAEIRPWARFHAPRPADDDSKAEQRRVDEQSWMGMHALIMEIVSLAEGICPPRLRRMPRRGRSQREWERMQNDAKCRNR